MIYVEADVLVLRNLDHLFRMPEISGSGSTSTLFNSGLMVIEPSNRTFQYLMGEMESTASQVSGDWDFFNRIFPWWHRIPRHMNYLKYFWTRQNNEGDYMNKLVFSVSLLASLLFVVVSVRCLSVYLALKCSAVKCISGLLVRLRTENLALNVLCVQGSYACVLWILSSSGYFHQTPLSYMQSIIGDTNPGNALETMTAIGISTSSLQAMKLMPNGSRYKISHSLDDSSVTYDLLGRKTMIFWVDAIVCA